MELKFSEVRKKDGTKIIFCDFEELIKESCHIEDLEDAKQFKTPGGEYVIHCPFCRDEGHTKHKLYLKDDFTVGHCFVCGRSYVHLTNEIKFKIDLPPTLSEFGLARPPLKLVPLTDPNWTLDKFVYDFEDSSEAGERYLFSRHRYMKDLYKLLDFKFWDGNIVMPFKHKGEVFYYQIRFNGVGHGDSRIRYFFPPISEKPPYIIDHLSPSGEECKGIIIVEGVFDAIACLVLAPNYIPVAVLGSSISDYQIDFIREYTGIKKIVVYMDETDISKRIADKLKKYIDYCPIYVVKSEGQDPEEKLKELISWGNGREINYIKEDYGDAQSMYRTGYKQVGFIH